VDEVDYVFAENGLKAFDNGTEIGTEVSHSHTSSSFLFNTCTPTRALKAAFFFCVIEQSLKTYPGEDNIKMLINYILRYIADADVPVKRCDSFSL
jgi:hypothetical protein